MNYFNGFVTDFRSSIVVFLVALPLCLGISLASGAPLLAGIIAGIVGGIVVGLLSNSHTSVSGPAAGLTVIVLGAIQQLGDFQAFTLAVFFAGFIQIILGSVKAGNAGAYFPNSVIKGMLAAIGLILILKQIPHAVGFDSDYMGDESFSQSDGQNTFSEIFRSLGALNHGAMIISSLSIFALIAWDYFSKKGVAFFKSVPGPLFVVGLGVFLNSVVFANIPSLLIEKSHLVSLPVEGGILSLFATLKMPQWHLSLDPAVWKIALTLAIVASLETLLSVEAVDKLDTHKRKTNKNQELLAQGVGNALCGLVGALPVTSVIVRSSANVSSGSQTKLSCILHGFWLLLAVALIPRYLEMIPLASLAAILILVGYKLSSIMLFKKMASLGKDQLIPFVVTILAILFTDLLVGVFIGILTGFVFVLRSNASKAIVMVNEEKNFLIRFMKDVSFLQKPFMSKLLEEIPTGSSVVIDGSNHVYVDNDIIAIIEDFLEVADERKIKCEIIKSTLARNAFFKE